MLPLRSGDRVLVLGGYPGIARGVAAAGALPTTALRSAEAYKEAALEGHIVPVVADAPLALPDASVDHVMAPVLSDDFSGLVPGEVARVLRPGGRLFLGVTSRLHAPRHPAAWTVGRATRVLERSGFAGVRSYGVRQSLVQPRYLVPLDQPAVLRWYRQSAFLPRNTVEAGVARLAALVPSRWMSWLLFPAYGFTAVRVDG